jgi:hypothetical protein
MRHSLALIAAVICWFPAIGRADPIVFCWDGSTHQPGLSPMAWVYCDTPTPEQSASKVADAFAHIPPQQRSILLANVFRRGHPFEATHLKDIIKNGPATRPDIQYLQTCSISCTIANWSPLESSWISKKGSTPGFFPTHRTASLKPFSPRFMPIPFA